MKPCAYAALVGVLVAGLLASPAGARRDRAPGFAEQSLDLPGVPAAVLPADLDADGSQDLVVLVAFTAWTEVSETEQMEFDGIEGLVEVMNVVSSLVDRRELRVYPGRAETGRYGKHLPPLELDTSVHALATSDSGHSLLALTDEGVAEVRLVSQAGEPTPVLEPLLAAPSLLTGSGTFYADFDFLYDLDGDGRTDALLPIENGWAIYRGSDDGFEPATVAILTVPERNPEDDDRSDSGRDSVSDSDSEGEETKRRPRRPRQPQVKDVTGDGRLDLVVFKADRGRDPLVYTNLGDLAFSEAIEVALADGGRDEEIVYIGDLDGDGLASVVAAEELEPGDDAGIKKEIEHAKKPDFRYRVYPLGNDLIPATEPTTSFEAEGYTFEGEEESADDDEDIDIKLPGGFQDLDGDGRQDLVAITLDFSLVPLLFRVLVLRSVSLRMDFHPHCQGDDGSFGRVPGLDLSGKFKINLRNVQVKHLSQFEGDFNGDGRSDFVQLGRGKKVTIHHGRRGCSYPVRPDRQIVLEREPRHLGLTRILDLDANGRSDLYVVHPEKAPKSGESIPVRLDLYLSEGPPASD
jgi:hypothetical protein